MLLKSQQHLLVVVVVLQNKRYIIARYDVICEAQSKNVGMFDCRDDI